MGNGFGPLLQNLDSIRYKHPAFPDENCEYWLRSSYNHFENYVEIGGLDTDRAAGPWGGSEIDCELGRVILPDEVAVKIAAAILRSRADCSTGQWWSGDKPCWVCESGWDHEALINLLDGILRDELDRAEAEPASVPLGVDEMPF